MRRPPSKQYKKEYGPRSIGDSLVCFEPMYKREVIEAEASRHIREMRRVRYLAEKALRPKEVISARAQLLLDAKKALGHV